MKLSKTFDLITYLRFRMIIQLIVSLTFVMGTSLFACANEQEYKMINPTTEGIGKIYMGRHISRFMSHLGANWLERPERFYQERPNILINSLLIKPNYIIADIGAGTGYFSFKLSKLVPQGKVYAVDIQEKMLGIINKKITNQGVKNIQTVLGTITDPKLPENKIDIAILVDAYHEFSHPKEMCNSIFKSMKIKGKLVMVEYRAEDDNIPIKQLHKMTNSQIIKEISSCGFSWEKTDSKSLPWQHIVVFIKKNN